MRHSLLVFLLFSNLSAFTQKPILDTSAFRKWASVGEGILSDDGKYVSYRVYNQPAGSRRLVVQSTTNDWKREFNNASMVGYSTDNRLLIFKTSKDSLCLLTLGKEDITIIAGVSEFGLVPDSDGGLLDYRLASDPETIILRNLLNGNERHFYSVTNHQFFDNGKSLLLETQNKTDTCLRLHWIDLSTDKMKTIWSAGKDEKGWGYSISSDGNQLAFVVERKKNELPVYELWYYRFGMDSSIKLADDYTQGIDLGLGVARQVPTFSKDGNTIFFGLRMSEIRKPRRVAAQVDVWSYTDKVLQPLQIAEAKQYPVYSGIIHIGDKQIVRLEQPDESTVGSNDNFVLVRHEPGYYSIFESDWNTAAQTSYWLISIRDGSRKLLRNHLVHAHEGLGWSPGGKWILYYDRKQKNYFSYEIATGVVRNITKGIAVNWLDEGNDRPELKLSWVPWRRTWLREDEAVLIYDNWDIWEVDPSGAQPPINLTNGCGRRHHIKFGLAAEGPELQALSVEKKSELLLTAYNASNKDRGFFKKTLGAPGDPERCVMGPYVFGDWGGYDSYNYPPVKAKSAKTYLLKRMSATEAPNYFVTRDLIHLDVLTNIQPQKSYNWMKSELIHWKTADGRYSEAILYKPEDFDAHKKYPILFDYYEMRSDELNLFIWPGNAEHRINIAWYVSHGYLVCTPDIHYKIGEPGQSAYDGVVSAALYLSNMPWVDRKRMGIQGHSFGGYETNYIVTHTGLFAAACSASGISDLIGWYGATLRGSYGKFWSEREQGRMGGSPWEIPEAYIKESPIFKANKVTTPLLMMSNKGDGVVPFAQGVEFFTALRRLSRRAWLLQYDEGGHSVGDEDAADYSLRMAQFFDHYLKGAPAPVWMTKGIPATLKGIEDGFEPDNEIKTPGLGLDGRRTQQE